MRAIAFASLCALLLPSCQPAATAERRAVATAMRHLETRIAALEAKEGEKATLPPGAASSRIASLRRGADDLEKAELARRRGDAARAAALFQDAVEEVGADALVDVEPL